MVTLEEGLPPTPSLGKLACSLSVDRCIAGCKANYDPSHRVFGSEKYHTHMTVAYCVSEHLICMFRWSECGEMHQFRGDRGPSQLYVEIATCSLKQLQVPPNPGFWKWVVVEGHTLLCCRLQAASVVSFWSVASSQKQPKRHSISFAQPQWCLEIYCL